MGAHYLKGTDMALTLAEKAALAAGYPMPEGNDRISDGDDAIRAAGVTAHGREYRRPALDGSVTLDALTTPGYHPIPNGTVAAAIGAPSDFQAQGGVYVDISGWSGSSGPILRQTLWAYTRDHRLTRTRLSNGSYGSWATGILRPDLGNMVGNMMRLSRWIATNPAVYTGGKGAVAFTFDHGLTKFKSAGLPGVLAGYGWGYGLALNDSTLSAAENNGATTADILSWAGAEIWNHGLNHSATANPDTAKNIVVQGKTALEARFGREVFGFIPAGVGPTGLAGFDGGSTPEMFATTIAGQMIMEHHAVTTGYMGAGGVRQLDGRVQQGIGRFTMDAQTVSRIKLQIDLAVTDRVGVMFMLHPALLDTTGYITTAQLLQVLAYARQREQAGALAVLSPGELVRADAGPAPALAAKLPAAVYDSGPRNVSGLLANGWTGKAYLWRTGTGVTLRVDGLNSTSATSGAFLTLMSGFTPRPIGSENFRVRFELHTASSVVKRGAVANTTATLFDYTPGDVFYGEVHLTTLDTPPAPGTEPGSPA